MNNKGFVISFVSYVFTILFLFFINYTTSWGHTWFIYPAFALAFVPLAFLCSKNKRWKLFSVLGFLLLSVLLLMINFITSPSVMWFVPAIYAAMWWPIAVLLGKKAGTTWFAIVVAIASIAFLVAIHTYRTPNIFLWYWYAVLPIIWYPVSMFFYGKVDRIKGGIISIIIFIAYYLILNYILFPGLTNAVSIVFAGLWGLIGVICGMKRKFFAMSILGSLITIAYLGFINLYYSPNVIWVVYPAFAIIWWPMSYYFFKVRKKG